MLALSRKVEYFLGSRNRVRSENRAGNLALLIRKCARPDGRAHNGSKLIMVWDRIASVIVALAATRPALIPAIVVRSFRAGLLYLPRSRRSDHTKIRRLTPVKEAAE